MSTSLVSRRSSRIGAFPSVHDLINCEFVAPSRETASSGSQPFHTELASRGDSLSLSLSLSLSQMPSVPTKWTVQDLSQSVSCLSFSRERGHAASCGAAWEAPLVIAPAQESKPTGRSEGQLGRDERALVRRGAIVV
jgi:hypothetical protein